MDDSTFYKYLLGLLLMTGSLLFGWTHHRASSAHNKIDDERKDNEDRFKMVYAKIARQEGTIITCKDQIEEDIKHHMTEVQIKDFVDRSIKPIETQIKVVHDDVKEILKEMRLK